MLVETMIQSGPGSQMLVKNGSEQLGLTDASKDNYFYR